MTTAGGFPLYSGMPDNSARIAEIEAILESGVTSSNIDGTQETTDFAQLRLELSRLRATDTTQRVRRPRLSSVNLRDLAR